MRVGLGHILACVFVAVTASFVSADEWAAGPKQVEKYRYEAIPDNGGEGKKESIEMEFIHSDNAVLSITRITKPGWYEETRITTKPDGTFISAKRETLQESEKSPSRDTIRRDHQTIVVERDGERGSSLKKFTVPEGKILAVDASLLVLMRKFPFSKDTKWDIVMIDFSRYAASVTLRHAGDEMIRVPAGEFACHRMELVVNLFIFHPKIIYWVAKEKPHFLVKQLGKRGPFTPSYTTSLVAVE